jgi:peptide/nickel transport system ATP-binding protein
LEGRNLLDLSEAEMRAVRGDAISMIFQEPMTSLNPVQTAGAQIVEAIRLHRAVSAAEARARALEMLKLVRIPSPETRLDEYPHQLSGGMRQRIMIAMALACDPRILIADEPTTALDVTIQAQILDLLRDLRERTGTAIMLITHDLGVVAELAHRVIVMYAGRIVEEAPVDLLFADPQHPYTLGLLGSIPRLGSDGDERLTAIEGMVPNPYALPPGCRFSPRCPLADARCKSEQPQLREIGRGHRAACWKAPLDLALAGAAAS